MPSFWGMFAAEVRHRAAGDGSFLLPDASIVKGAADGARKDG
jgi:hypothetical protein